MQRSQRDTTRKNDASRLLAAVNDSRAANRGQLPAAGANVNTQIVDRYVTVGGSTFVDPASGNPYTTGTILNGAQAGNIGAGTMQVIRNAQCGDNGTAVAGNGVVIRAGVESSPNVAYCLQG
ncbi:MAG: hypothetical protein Q4A21_01330 [bacterium]|nr:hypothetical protein [bacterium]